MALRDYLVARRAEIEDEIKRLRAELGEIKIAEAALTGDDQPRPTAARSSTGIRDGSIKDWILKALSNTPDGMETEEVMTSIRLHGGPEVSRSSITPQLSRLKAAKLIELNGRHWSVPIWQSRNEETPVVQPTSAPTPEVDFDDEIPF